MDHIIINRTGIIETIPWPLSRPWSYEDEEANRVHSELLKRVIARAYEVKGLPYEVRNPNWKESDLYSFACRETEDGQHVVVTTPVGEFKLAARRAQRGSLKTAVSGTGSVMGFGARAHEDQISLPVLLNGRLNAPRWEGAAWSFQPDSFIYEDGTSSDYLGSPSMDIEWISLEW